MTGKSDRCCGAARSAEARGARGRIYAASALAVVPASGALRSRLRSDLIDLAGGVFDQGSRRSTFAGDLDAPRIRTRLAPFAISPTAVTNSEFARFIMETGYVTVAEREGWSFVSHLFLEDPDRWTQSPPGLPWWRKVDGVSWRKPHGPGSSIGGLEDHPVVHIAWYDALAYCRWSGLRLPSEAEWEFAARGGLARKKFPWGNALRPNGGYAMNTWQGAFPNQNTADDGYLGTAPVRAFSPNGYGLYNMTGNVWEWVRDVFGPLTGSQPRSEDPPDAAGSEAPRVQRGGSYLCHDSYCDRYHVHSRTKNDPDSSTGHCGFRLAGNAN